MPNVSDSALKDRARQMLIDMTQRERWIYALPAGAETQAALSGTLSDAGLPEVDSGADGRVRKYQDGSGKMHILVFEHSALGVVLVEARGGTVVPFMQKLLEATSFIPQSQLWATALDVTNENTTRSLTTLAHMAVAWDEDWADLFILHLASPDPIVRNEATKSLVLAAMVSAETADALTILGEAHKRERYPKLRDTMAEAIRVVEAFAGEPLSWFEAPQAPDAGL